jgi:hypothetical protein
MRHRLAVLLILGVVCPAALSAQTASVRGRVLHAETGRPIAGATVALPAASRETRTDSLGQFDITNLRPGEYELLVQAVGFTPARATLPLAAGPPVELDIDLDPLPPTLERVVTEADADAPRNVAMAEFEERRAMGLGRFITRAELLRDRGRTFDAVVRARLPGVRLVNEGGQVLATSGRGTISIVTPLASRCHVNVFVDNVLRYANGTFLPPFDLRSLEASMIAGVEFYTTASTPARFNPLGTATCGTLVIWLQQ